MDNNKIKIGVIGGSGVYDIEAIDNKSWQKVNTPFGEPSDELLFGKLENIDMVFLPRHGRGHKFSPSEINYRANILAMKQVGVTDIISVSAVGSLREDLPPGTFVIIDQFIDRTFARPKTFFENGCVAHISMAHPTCSRLGKLIAKVASNLEIKFVSSGTYLAMEGPQFSSLAESKLYQSWGCDVIGMTNMPEAKLAREAEICYATVAMVTDFDCWHPNHDAVNVTEVIKALMANADNARKLVINASPLLFADTKSPTCCCKFALDNAIITAPNARLALALTNLTTITQRVLNK